MRLRSSSGECARERKKTDLGLTAGVVFAALLLATGCSSLIPTARITDMVQGRTLDVKFPTWSQGGSVTRTASDGEVFSGNCSRIPVNLTGEELLLKLIGGVAAEAGNAAANKGYFQLAGSMNSISNREEYEATLAGNQGTVIDLVFAVDSKTGHGTGQGKDNKGNHYKVQM